MELGLEGRVAIVTGASMGIGLEVALGLAREGVDVVICARRRPQLDVAAEAIRATGAAVEPITADVTDPGVAVTVRNRALERFDRLDILINNAGKSTPKPILEQTDDEWRDSFELNLLSAVRFALACAPVMRQRGWGRIVNISSRMGLEPDPYFAPYGATKAGLINFTKSLANAISKDGVLTNCIIPGLIRGEGVEAAARKSAAATGTTPEEVMAEMLRRRPIPVGRIGEPSDVAGLAVLLASEAASWITGAAFTVDGGIVRSPF